MYVLRCVARVWELKILIFRRTVSLSFHDGLKLYPFSHGIARSLCENQ